MSRTAFFESILGHLLLPAGNSTDLSAGGGQCFIICDSGKEDPHVDLTSGQIPAMMFPYGDDRVTKWMENKKFKGWKLRISDAEKYEYYLPNQIIRIAQFNPYDWLAGVSAMSPGQIVLLQDVKADLWNSRTFENDAVPGGVLQSESIIPKEMAEELQRRWHQKYGGPGNARRIAVLGAGLKFQQIAVNAKDMEFVNQKTNIRKSFLSLFGLNEIALGNYEQINYATIVEGRRMLWEDTYLPLDERINEAFTNQFVKWLDQPRNNLELKSDLTKVPALRRDMKEPIANAKVLYDMGAPFMLACSISGVPLPKDVEQKYPWLNEKPAPAPSPFGPSPSEEEEGEEKPEKPEGEKSIRVKHKRSNEELTKIADDYVERVLAPGESYFLKRLQRLFITQRNAMLDKVDAWLAKNKMVKASVPSNVDPSLFVLSSIKETEKLVKIYRDFTKVQLGKERQRLIEELGKDKIRWNVTDPLIDRYVDRRKKDLLAINDLTFAKVKEKVAASVAEAVKENKTVVELAADIKEDITDVGEISSRHAMTIARTETQIISGDARYGAFQSAGIEFTQWVTSSDDKVRDSHMREGAGSPVPLGDPFPVTGLKFPGDTSTGELEEFINCRCVAIPVAPEDVEG
jgi:hypothetical protein